MEWLPFDKVYESEQKHVTEVCSALYQEHWRRQPYPQFSPTVQITGEVDSCSIGKDQLGSDKSRVGKLLVGSIKGFVQLVPDVSATVIGANTGTLKLNIAVCTQTVLLDSVTGSKDWQQ